MLQESTGHRYRPVIKMLPDGSIMMGNIEHHPYCIPLTKTEVIFQQVNRAKRMLPAGRKFAVDRLCFLYNSALV